jgi:hypothetical protein
MRCIVKSSLLLIVLSSGMNVAAQEPPPAEPPQPSAPAPVQPATPAPPDPAATQPSGTAASPAAASPTEGPAEGPEGAQTPATRDVSTGEPEQEAKPAAPAGSAPAASPWQISFTGYFRAPMMISTSRRSDPANPASKERTQLVYAPNRLVDANYSSFGFTRLQEGDWGEAYLTAKKDHVAATIAFMGYWYSWSGYEYPGSSWAPAQGWVTLDSDVKLGPLTPHVEFKGGVFWQRWGMFGKYDTYVFGRFHQSGEALQVDLPINSDLQLRLVHGFGVNRGGSPSAGTGVTLLNYLHAALSYQKLATLGVYYNDSWTKDPTLFTGPAPAGGGPYVDAQDGDMRVLGADIDVTLPVYGHLWLAGSHIKVKNGWSLSQTVEILHSPGGAGIANNYLAFGQTGSTGTGTLTSLALLYENSLSNLQGRADNPILPDLTLNLFGMMVNANRDLVPGATISDELNQLKWGADLTLTTLPWLAFMLRYDSVDLDTDNDGFDYGVITPRVTFFSHFLSSENIWIQYSRYFYGDNIALPTSPTQPYSQPDENVIKLQANMSF